MITYKGSFSDINNKTYNVSLQVKHVQTEFHYETEDVWEDKNYNIPFKSLCYFNYKTDVLPTVDQDIKSFTIRVQAQDKVVIKMLNAEITYDYVLTDESYWVHQVERIKSMPTTINVLYDGYVTIQCHNSVTTFDEYSVIHYKKNQEELILSDTPFVVELNGDESDVFKPVKYMSATLSILSEKYIPDLFTAKPTDVFVHVTDSSGKTVFGGFISPEIYSQEYDNVYDLIELNCIDGLSTLQFFDYSPVSTTPDYRTVTEIIQNILNKSGAYIGYYLPFLYVFDDRDSFTDTEPIYNHLFINEGNFFDEDGVPMKCDEVLEEICKYLGLTAITEGEFAYFVSYESVAKCNRNYYYFDLGDPIEEYSPSHLYGIAQINYQDISGDGISLSIDEVYNKIKVVDEFYNVETFVPELFDENNIVQVGKKPFESVLYLPASNTGVFNGYWVLNKYFNNTCVKPLYDRFRTLGQSHYAFSLNTDPYVELVRVATHETTATSLSDVDKSFVPSWSDYLVFKVVGNNDIPMVEISSENSSLYFYGLNLVINFDVANYGSDQGYYDYPYISQPAFMNRYGYSPIKDKQDFLWTSLKCKLQIGSTYWNGSSWQKTETTFDLPLNVNGKSAKVKNTVEFLDGIDEEGYKVPITQNLSGKVKLTIYSPKVITDRGFPMNHSSLWFSNLKFQIKNVDSDLNFDNDDDTVYENVIDEENVTEFDEIKLKVNTWDNKQPNLSSVMYGSTKPSGFLDEVYNTNTRNYFRAEEHIINKYVSEYSKPQLRVTGTFSSRFECYALATLDFIGSNDFVIDSYSWDIAHCQNQITFKEIFISD